MRYVNIRRQWLLINAVSVRLFIFFSIRSFPNRPLSILRWFIRSGHGLIFVQTFIKIQSIEVVTTYFKPRYKPGRLNCVSLKFHESPTCPDYLGV